MWGAGVLGHHGILALWSVDIGRASSHCSASSVTRETRPSMAWVKMRRRDWNLGTEEKVHACHLGAVFLM